MAEGRASTKLRLAVVAGVWLAVTGAAALVPGCYGRTCDASYQLYGRDPGQGAMIDPDTWESNPVEGGWLPLPGSRTWFFEVPALSGRRYKRITPWISGSPAPQDAGANYTVGSGSTVIVPQPNGFWIVNSTCADYFLRVQVEAYPADDAGLDGGAEGGLPDGGDAGPTDAAARD